MGLDSRGQISINGNSIPVRSVSSASAEAETKTALRTVFSNFSNGYSDIYLEKFDLTSANNENLNFNAEWTYESEGVIAGTNYSTINSL